jgi:hypothetical protein
MQVKNLTVEKSPVKSLDELYFGNSKYKCLYGHNNLRQITSRETLLEEGFYELEAAYDTFKRQEDPMTFKNSENKQIVTELAQFSAKYPDFVLDGKMSESLSDDVDEDCFKTSFTVTIKDGSVKVVVI